jgi:RimJ/RimL family protein N-acetyltransferase
VHYVAAIAPVSAFPALFVTPRLRATRLLAVHVETIHAMHSDPVQMAPLGGVRSAADTTAYMDRHLQHWDEHGFGVWIVHDIVSDAIAGRVLLRHLTLEGVPEVEVGYSLLPAYWGQGLAPEIAGECVRLGQHRLGLGSIVALTRPDNARSRRVMEKIGLEFEREYDLEAGSYVVYRTPPLTA